MRYDVTYCRDDPMMLKAALNQITQEGWNIFQVIWRGPNDVAGLRHSHYVIVSKQGDP